MLLIAGIACGGPSDPVRAVLSDLEEAAEARDAEAFASLLAPDFKGAGAVDRAEALAMLRRYFAGYESVSLEVYDVMIDRSDSAADVRFRVDFAGSARRTFGLEGFLPPAASYVFILKLGRRDGRWLVTSAEWESALPAPSP